MTSFFNPKNILLLAFLLAGDVLFAQQTGYALCDKNATAQTKALYQNLKRVSAKGYLFGHQDDLAYGVNWRYQPNRSDVKDACGDYPALFGWDLGGIEKDTADKNLDSVPFDKMRNFIKAGYKSGAAITITWHLNNPLTGGNAWDNKPGAVTAILPGGAKHQLFTTWLDKVAAFMLSLQGDKKELIPVLFRPYHELSGSWFWWGKNNCSPGEFKALWQFTKNYLTDIKKCHNLIYVYNTGTEPNDKAAFMERYPGNNFADVLSFDNYQGGDPSKDNSFINKTALLLNIIDSAAAENNKLTAMAETGFEAIPYTTWWTGILQKAIGSHHIAWVLVWRNHGYQEATKRMHYFAPYKGQASQNDFIAFYNSAATFFERDAAKENLYKNIPGPGNKKNSTKQP